MPTKTISTTETAKDRVNIPDIQASLRVIEWVNQTLDATVRCLGKQGTREASLVLLILHKEGKALSGKKLVQRFRSWTATHRSPAVEESLRLATGVLLRLGQVEAGAVDEVPVLQLKRLNPQIVIGMVLQEGLQGLKEIQLTRQGDKVVKVMRRTIDERLSTVVKDISRDEMKLFKRLIGKSLPFPPRDAALGKAVRSSPNVS